MRRVMKQALGQGDEPLWMAVLSAISFAATVVLFVLFAVALGAK